MKSIILTLLITFLFSRPEYTVLANNNPFPGKLFIHSMSEYMAILDTSLNYYWLINNNNKGMDFKYNNSKISYYHKPTYDSNEAYWIIADSYMTEIDSIQCTQGLTDYHDMIVTNDSTYILQSYDNEVIDLSSLGASEFQLVSSILRIQEFDLNNQLIFEWYASDHLNIYDYDNLFIGNVPGTIEWMHGNSLDIDYDNNLIISNRKGSEIIKIDRENGNVIWIMGGPLNEFTIHNDPLNGVSWQHDVSRLENGNILIFDNGNHHTPHTSRAVEYSIDETNKTATLVWEYRNPYGYKSKAMGSAQRLPNGNTLINWGTILVENIAMGASIIEVDSEDNIVLEIQYDTYQSYKVTKSDFEFDIPMGIGDLNLDNSLNIQDIIYIVNYILYHDGNHSMFNLYKIDSNLDHLINIIDIIEIIDRILSD
tara:strand:+ start:1253 stop:2524 length:1272 start_codon:yes stop_codon:yes gene_type:complete